MPKYINTNLTARWQSMRELQIFWGGLPLLFIQKFQDSHFASVRYFLFFLYCVVLLDKYYRFETTPLVRWFEVYLVTHFSRQISELL